MVEVEKMSLSSAYAIDYFVDNLSTLAADRSRLQSLRRRSDRDLFPLFRNALEPAYGMPSYLAAHDELVDAFGIGQNFVAKHRVLVVTGEPLLARMAGPAIRAWEIAKALAPEHDVWLVSTVGVRREGEGFRASRETGTSLVAATEWADVIIFQGFLLEFAPKLHTNSKILVADIYDPIHLEQLAQGRDLGPERRSMSVRKTTRVLNEQIARADFMLCASDKQRDFWLGQLAGQGRVNPAVYDEDHRLASLLAVVPFGIPDEAPVQKRHAIRGAIPGIGPDDKVIIWGGGIYNWFDPLTLLRAVARLSERHDDLRLFFMGLKHPNPGVPRMRVAWQAQELAKELGLTDRVVFFNEGWVPYDERADYLLDADLGVSTHFHHIETAFSFRTRILDYLWASLPIVATEGDTFGTFIRQCGLGRTVPAKDPAALERALEEMLYDSDAIETARASVRVFAEGYRWSAVLRPLVEFCRNPRRAVDLANAITVPTIRTRRVKRPRYNPLTDLGNARNYLRVGGVRELVRRVCSRLKNILGSPR